MSRIVTAFQSGNAKIKIARTDDARYIMFIGAHIAFECDENDTQKVMQLHDFICGLKNKIN